VSGVTTASAKEIVDNYYRLANAGSWDAWCDLFTDDMVMDEQLAGHIEGLATLRPMMAGMGRAYSRFQNVPKHILVDGDQAAVVSHISAANAAGEAIEADVMNYFRFRDGKIAYMANFHDSRPFKPFLEQKLD
jgi:ketosteroid isomerase-like protein